MSVRTLTPPMNASPREEPRELRFFGPPEQHAAAIALLTPLGFFVVTPATVPWREVLPQIPAAEKPGWMLRAARVKGEMTQDELARRTGIPRRHISEMEHG